MDLEEKVEELAEKVKRLEAENQRLKKELDSVKKSEGDVSKNSEGSEIDRRDFLKKLGAGMAGLGALSLSPVSGLDVRDSEGLKVFSGGSKYLDVNSGGGVDVLSGDLNLDTGQAVSDGSVDRFGVEVARSAVYDADGDLGFLAYDTSSGGGQRRIVNYSGSAKSFVVQDSDKTLDRLVLNDGAFILRDGDGDNVFRGYTSGSGGGDRRFYAFNGKKVKIRDAQGSFEGVEYISGSSKGTFRTTNSNLDMSGNSIIGIGGTNAANGGVIQIKNNSDIRWRDSSNNNDITGITVDDSDRIQLGRRGNADQVRLATNGSTNFIVHSNGSISLEGNELREVTRIDGNSGNHRIRFDSNNSWIEFTDQSNNRNDIVINDVYIDSTSTGWLSNIENSSNNNIDADEIDGYDVQKNGSDTSGVINFKT